MWLNFDDRKWLIFKRPLTAHYQPMQCVGPHLRAGERSDRSADWHFEAYGRYPKRFAFLRCSGPGTRRSGDCPA